MDILDTVLDFIKNNGELIALINGLLMTHFGASVYVASTKTKASKLYKIIEALALVIGKTKEKI